MAEENHFNLLVESCTHRTPLQKVEFQASATTGKRYIYYGFYWHIPGLPHESQRVVIFLLNERQECDRTSCDMTELLVAKSVYFRSEEP